MAPKKKENVNSEAAQERRRIEQEQEKKRREAEDKKNKEALLKKRLRDAADRAATVDAHPHPLHLTELCHREMIDPENPGKLLYEYDGAGSFYCRNCLKLMYGSARHCVETVPPYDMCDPCFQQLKSAMPPDTRPLIPRPTGSAGTARSATVPWAPKGASKGDGDLGDLDSSKRVLTLPGISSRIDSDDIPTPRSLFRDVQRGVFHRLQDMLRPKPRSSGVRVDDVATENEHNGYDYSTVDDHTGRTLLHFAAEAGTVEIAFKLLQVFAVDKLDGEIDRRDHDGMTPLMLGALQGRTGVVEELLYSEADTRPTCCRGYDALMLAASRGHADVIARLLHAGAAVNTRSSKGRTALAIASLNGHCESVRTLLQFPGCDATLRDDEGYSPVLLAAARGHHDVVKLYPDEARKELRW